MRPAPTRFPSLTALLWLALTLAVTPAHAADQAQGGEYRRSAVRVGCGTLADSRGRNVSQEAGSGNQPARPGHCPGQTPTASQTPAAQDAASPQSPESMFAPAPTTAEPPASPQAVAAKPSAKRPRTASRLPQHTTAALPPTDPAHSEPAEAAPLMPLETTRTTHAFGEPPRLALDPIGAGMALVAGGSLLWLLRSGFAASLLLLGLPVWRDIDLLPVVAAGASAPESSDEPPVDQDANGLFDGDPPSSGTT